MSDRQSSIALVNAVLALDVSAVELLLRGGVNPNTRTPTQSSPVLALTRLMVVLQVEPDSANDDLVVRAFTILGLLRFAGAKS